MRSPKGEAEGWSEAEPDGFNLRKTLPLAQKLKFRYITTLDVLPDDGEIHQYPEHSPKRQCNMLVFHPEVGGMYHYPEHSPRRPENMVLSRTFGLKTGKYTTTQSIRSEDSEICFYSTQKSGERTTTQSNHPEDSKNMLLSRAICEEIGKYTTT